MPLRHVLVALLVIVVWSFNFIAIRVGLNELPPIFMAAVRFLLTALPAVFFVRPPAAPWQRVAAYGILVFAMQFGLLFCAMVLGLSPALAALSLQLSVIVTIGLAAVAYKERVSAVQVAGGGIAAAGLLLIAVHTGGDITAAGLLLGVLAACCWGAGNIVGKSIGKVDMLALIVWSSLAAPVPLMFLSLMLEGPTRIIDGVKHLSVMGLAAVAYTVYVSTHLGYSLWAWLTARHPAAQVAPFTLLAPILAGIFSALLLGETFPAWKLGAGLLVLGGVTLNLLGPRLLAMGARAREV